MMNVRPPLHNGQLGRVTREARAGAAAAVKPSVVMLQTSLQ